MNRILLIAAFYAGFAIPLLGQVQDAADRLPSRIPKSISGFELPDFRGKVFGLKDVATDQLAVIAFVGVECPLAGVYTAELIKLSKEYESKGVQFIAIDSNQQDTLAEIGHFARQHQVDFPLLKDAGNRVADQFGAKRTPEVFLLSQNEGDSTERAVRYWGRIDDQFGVGYARPGKTNHYLKDAIDDLLSGSEVRRPSTEPVGCHIGRVRQVEPTGDITYCNQVSRIIQDRCVECHRETGIAPFALQTYEDVAAWSETICEVVADQRMPPWHADPKHGTFSNDARMKDTEKETLFRWLDNGVPEGDRNDLPPTKQFQDGWALGAPDLVLRAPRPIQVPATGVMNYKYVTIDPGFKEGKWVRASEVRPGVRSVVHHILVFIHPPGGDPVMRQFGVGFESLGGYVPGTPPMDLADGVARYVPPGATLTLQIHYTPDGIAREDQSEIGLYFADPTSIKYTMQTIVAANLDFVIPARAENHQVEATHRVSQDMAIHNLTPHMHYRGKSFRYEAIYPNGSREILLSVPKYDFNWQNTYRLDRPKYVPEGTLIRCVANFDNSEGNLANPDPNIRVAWGEQTWQEMMIGFAEGVFLNQDMALPSLPIEPLGGNRFRVTFSYRPDRPHRELSVAGSFNDWSTISHPLSDADGDGVYTAVAEVLGGEHRYKFVIDGKHWSHDPSSRILTGFFHDSFFAVEGEAAK